MERQHTLLFWKVNFIEIERKVMANRGRIRMVERDNGKRAQIPK